MVRDRGSNGTLRGRPWSLPPIERVPVVSVCYRTNGVDDGPGSRRLWIIGWRGALGHRTA
ncbi:hypothetical protein GCM10027074_66970 [Streptomyces deserti]